MNKTLEQYRSSLYGLFPEYRGKFSERVVARLSKYVPEAERETLSEDIRSIRSMIEKNIETDEKTQRYELGYRERRLRHQEHKKAYEADTPFTP